MLNYRICLEGWNQTKQECTDWRDDGYQRCDSWGQDCTNWAKKCVVSWIPFIGPIICKVFEWVCTAAKWVCKAAVWVTQWVCHAYNVITTFVCLVWETITVITYIPGIFIKTILAIPIIGGLIKEIINFITGFVLGLVGFVIEGIFCGLFGICLAKKMRLCVILTEDAKDPAMRPNLDQLIAKAKQVFKDEANVLVNVEVSGDAAVPRVTPNCGGKAWLEDIWLTGTSYEHHASLHCREYSLNSVIGLASPLYAFAVKDVIGKNGCSLWLFTNYITFEAGNTCANGFTHLAHEMGHACGLLHPASDDPTNLMNPDCVAPPGRDQLSGFQKSILRGSKYVTYF